MQSFSRWFASLVASPSCEMVCKQFIKQLELLDVMKIMARKLRVHVHDDHGNVRPRFQKSCFGLKLQHVSEKKTPERGEAIDFCTALNRDMSHMRTVFNGGV